MWIYYFLYSYSVMVLFFIDCYVSITLKTDNYKRVLYLYDHFLSWILILWYLLFWCAWFLREQVTRYMRWWTRACFLFSSSTATGNVWTPAHRTPTPHPAFRTSTWQLRSSGLRTLSVCFFCLLFRCTCRSPELTFSLTAGIVVYLLLRRLRTVILSAKHDTVRTRFSQVCANFVHLRSHQLTFQ